jgi:hypothetical protein
MKTIDVTPLEIRDYAVSYGWVLVKEAIKDGLFALNSPNQDFKQIVFPIESSRQDFNSMAELAISRISEYTKKSHFSIVEEIREVNDDVISLRYYSDNKVVNSLSFQEALKSITATKQMILAASSSVVSPVLYHQRLGKRAEAAELLKMTRFRHTEEGSFILKISCPVQLESAPTPNLFEDENFSKPHSRRAFEIINQGAYKLLNTVEEDSFNELLEEQKESEKPIISYNLCDSMVSLFDDERELPFELKFNWSRAYVNKLPTPNFPQVIKFPYSIKPKLDELKNYFKPESKETTDTFFGTVESLNGNEGDDKRRSGQVILALIIEGEIVNARVNLNADRYDIAYKAHGQGGGLVKVKGILLPGTGIRTLNEVTVFEAVEK